MESLKGIFPQSQPPPKRDFLKENVMKIRNMQRMRKPNKETEYSRYNKQIRPRKMSLCENNAPSVHRSTNSLALCSTKAPINNLRKSVSSMSIQGPRREFGTQTVDPDDDFFLKDSIIRYPSASTIRSSSTVRPPSAHQTQTCSRGHQMEPSEENQHRPRFRSHFHERKDEHCDKVERHISNLSEFLDRGSISKKNPPSILKNSSTSSSQKSNKNYINESQRKEERIEENIVICESDDDDDDMQKEKRALAEKELGSGDAKERQLKAAAEDPNCPEGHVPLSESERLEALKLAKNRKKIVKLLLKLNIFTKTKPF
jgi:hypothetical protein